MLYLDSKLIKSVIKVGKQNISSVFQYYLCYCYLPVRIMQVFCSMVSRKLSSHVPFLGNIHTRQIMLIFQMSIINITCLSRKAPD